MEKKLVTCEKDNCPACGCPTHKGTSVRTDRYEVYVATESASMRCIWQNIGRTKATLEYKCYRCGGTWTQNANISA